MSTRYVDIRNYTNMRFNFTKLIIVVEIFEVILLLCVIQILHQ